MILPIPNAIKIKMKNSRDNFAVVFCGDVTILRVPLSIFCSIYYGWVIYLEQGIDNTIGPFKPSTYGPRSDKGKNIIILKLEKWL